LKNLKLLLKYDICRPYKPKKRTKATIAKEKGIETLPNLILKQTIDTPIFEIASEYISDEKQVFSLKEAIQGAQDIIAEIIR
jgi:uncharacterized protein